MPDELSDFFDHPELGRLARVMDAQIKRVEALIDKASKELVVQETPKKTRGTRLPDGWIPTSATMEKMRAELGVSGEVLVYEHRKFCDHFCSAPGQRGVKVDWDRAWCNWMRSASERGHLRTSQRQGRNNDDKIRDLMEMDVHATRE